jgi:hypothetical protein
MNKLRSLRIVLYATLIFFAGGMTGALVAPLIGRHFMRPPDPKQISYHMLARLQSGLHLSDEQTAKIKPLIEKTGAEMEAIHRETIKRVMSRIAETNGQISALLTTEQKTEFAKMEAEHRKRLARFHHFLGPHGPPPEP